jgi:hypothetical protein
MLDKDYDRKGSDENIIIYRGLQGAWRLDDLTGGKSPAVK